jgi:hypothetical protein
MITVTVQTVATSFHLQIPKAHELLEDLVLVKKATPMTIVGPYVGNHVYQVESLEDIRDLVWQYT